MQPGNTGALGCGSLEDQRVASEQVAACVDHEGGKETLNALVVLTCHCFYKPIAHKNIQL